MSNWKSFFSLLNLGWLPLWLSLVSITIFFINYDFYYDILTEEDGIIEYGTSICAFIACIIALIISRYFYKNSNGKETYVILLLALGYLFFAGEEISWGQRIFGIDVKEISPWLHEQNRQDELNLHNIRGISQVRLVADAFCLVWGIIIPFAFFRKSFPVEWLQPFLSPAWLVPGFITTLLITLPGKITELFWGEIQWVIDLRLGELKEFCFGLVCLLFTYHIYKKCKTEMETQSHQPESTS